MFQEALINYIAAILLSPKDQSPRMALCYLFVTDFRRNRSNPSAQLTAHSKYASFFAHKVCAFPTRLYAYDINDLTGELGEKNKNMVLNIRKRLFSDISEKT